jgi:LPS export ABC transporter protein LptC
MRNALNAVLLITLAAATWYWSLPAPEPRPNAVAASGARLGYYAAATRLLGTDDSGRLTYIVHADAAQESADGRSFELSGVRVEYRPESEVAWSVTATRASAPRSGSYLDLEGQVVLSSNPLEGDSTVITTSRLRFLPNDFVAETDAAVELSIRDNRVEALGLEAHLKEDRVRLESDVHGYFPR